MKEILDLAISIAHEVGALQRERFTEPRAIDTKSSTIDLVTDVDRASEEIALERIARARPGDAILAEETGDHAGRSEWLWIIDPLDGTTNYAHGFPHFAVSIGVERRGIRELGVIFDPLKNELFTARRGAGAHLNGQPIQVSRIDRLDAALLATGFGYDVHRSRDDNLNHFSAFVKCAQGVRRAGAAALDLAYVACGRFDGFWELHLHPWDVAAGLLLVEEAGGTSSDLDGGPVPRAGDRCVASNGRLHPDLLRVLAASSEAAASPSG
ncbi:MAG: inositol monophosphatase family protein [Myxococcota bacterium]